MNTIAARPNNNRIWQFLLAATFALWSSIPGMAQSNAGMDQTAVEGGYVQLWGYREVEDNVDHSLDTFLWEQLEGPDVTLIQGFSYDAARIRFNAPAVDNITDLVFRLTITNGEYQSSDDVTIVVYPIPDLGVEGVEFEIGDMQLTDTFGAGETFIRDIHPSNSELSRPVFEFAVAQSQLKDQAFYDNGNIPSAGIYPTQAGDWVVHNKAHLSFHYTDVTIRPNLEYLGSNPNGVSFLIWDRKDWSDGEDEHPILFGVNGESKIVQTLKDLDGLKLGGTRVSIVGAENKISYQGLPLGRSLGLVSVVGAPIEEFVIGAGTSIDVDHIYPAAPDWAEAGLIAEAGLNQDVYADQVIQLNGTLSTQSNDGSITYQWTQVDGAVDVELSDADSLQPTFIAPEVVDGFTLLTFQLTASDGAVSDQDTVEIKVFPAVVTANAGVDQTALEGSYVQLTGSNEGPGIAGSFDSYQWEQQSGPQIEVDGGGLMTNQTISFYAPNVDQITELTFDLSVTNGGVTSTDSVTVEVYPIQDLGVDCVNFDMGGNLISESYAPGDSFIHDIHNLDQAQNVPLFEFEVAESQLYDEAFFNSGNAAHAYISPGYENDAVYEAKFLYWQFADITIRPNPEEFDVLPSGITFLVRDEDYNQSEDFVFGVNQEHVVASGLRDLNGIRLGGTQITVIGGQTLNSVSMVSISGAPIEELLIGGGSKLKVDHICPAVPAWAEAGLIAEAGLNQDVYADQVIQLNGTLSTQSNDGSITYQWTQVDGAAQVVLSDADSLQPTFTAPEVVDGFMVLTFQLTVSQGNTSDQDTVEIKVFPHTVDANAGVDQEVESGALVTVDGSQSIGTSGELSYTWSQLQGPQITIADNSAESFSFNAPEVNENQVIILELTATLGGTLATDTVEITVVPAQVIGSDCEFYYLPGINFVEGPPEGGSPNPFSAPAYEGASEGETWEPNYVKAKYDLDFLGHMMSADFGGGIGEPYPALDYDTITFEPSNGWATVMGDDDRMAGDGAPYAGAEYTSAAGDFSGSYAEGDARGTVVYSTGDNSVTFELVNLGNSAVGGEMLSADTDRGVNMTPGGNYFLEIPVSETQTGGLNITFENPVPAAGMYVMGMEQGKRVIDITLTLANGHVISGHDPVIGDSENFRGPLDVGGVGIIAYRALSNDPSCYIKQISLMQPFNEGDTPVTRDIFSIDDLVFASVSPNATLDDAGEGGGADTPEDCEDAPLVVSVEFDSDTVGAESSHSSLVHSSTTDWTVVEDSGTKYYESTGSQTNLKVEFPSTVTLANGEALRVKVDYQYMSPPTDPGTQPFNFLRFGAYHDQGTTDYGDDIGYLADVSYWQQDTAPSATKTGDYAVRKEANFYNDFDLGPLLDNRSSTQYQPPTTPETGDIITMFDASGMRATWPKLADEGTSDEHAAVLCLVNVDGTLEARLFHGFPVTYIGSGVESGLDVQLSFNSIYLESPSDNTGFRVRRIAAQHVPVTLDCCEPDTDTPSDCILTFYDNRDDGPTGGGEPDPLGTGWSYPNAQAEQANFLNDIAGLGLSHELITFEQSNGWNPVNGTGDMFAGSGAPYAGGAYTSAAFADSGSMVSGDAAGSVSYIGADNTVTFSLYANGHAAGIDEPGIGDMDGSNDTDRGINTTPGGYHFLEALPSENQTGGLHIEFDTPVPAVGMYLMGVEDDKRDIEVQIIHADGSMQIRSADVTEGPHNEGGIQFVGYLAPDLQDNTCWIKSITFNELYDGETASYRDIFAIDDVIYPASEMNPPVDTIDVKGQVTLFGDGVTPIQGATVSVHIGSSSIYETATDQNGEYIMTVPSGGDYKFSARLAEESRANKGVDVTDIILLRKHILNREQLSSAMSWVAADPTRDNSIDVADIVEMRKVILNRTSSFSTNLEGKPEDLFRFVKLGFKDTVANLSFDNVGDAEFIGFEGISGNLTGVDFAGVKLGDVNSDWKPSASKSTTQSALPLTGYRPSVSASLYFGQMRSNEKGQLELPLYAKTNQALFGVQFEMNWDRSVFAIENITSSILPGFSADVHVNIGDATAKVAWDDAMVKGVELSSNQPLLTLHLSRLSEGASGFELESPVMAGAGGSLGLIQPASVYVRPDGTARPAMSGAIKSIELHGNQLHLLIDTKEGQHYQLQAAQSLEKPNWQNLIELEGNSAWQEVILHAEASSAFLRLVPIEAVIR
ncbi:hypothetical protein N8566_00925 [Verrucomicrobia bacterium]|nr:hypothetical protein [Verrucomicrobiota bacterium]